MISPRAAMSAAEVGRHYDDLDVFYREIWGSHLHHGRWQTGKESVEEAVIGLIESVADAADVKSGSNVCDVGCGYGGTSNYLASHRDAQVTAYTVSEAQHAYAVAENKGATNPTFHLCRWEENQLPESSVDSVVSIECFTHVPDKDAYFAEMRRVLKPSGWAGITVWMHNPDPKPWQIRHLIEPICYEGRLAGMGTADEYRELIEANGLVVDGYEDWSKQVAKTWSVCVQRLTKRIFTSSRYRKMLMDKGFENRVFAGTLIRLLTAYRLGVMRYGFFRLRCAAD